MATQVDPAIAAQLRNMQKSWDAAKKSPESMKDAGFAKVPDGKYMFQLDSTTLGNSASSGRLQMVWKWVITEGDQTGNPKYEYDGIVDSESCVYINRKLRKLGFDILQLDVTDLPEVCATLSSMKPMMRGRLQTGKVKPGDDPNKEPFQNLYWDQIYVGGAAEPEEESGPNPADATSATNTSANSSPEVEVEGEDAGETVEEQAEIGIGSKVDLTLNGAPHVGLVREFLTGDEAGKIKVLVAGKLYKIALSAVTLHKD